MHPPKATSTFVSTSHIPSSPTWPPSACLSQLLYPMLVLATLATIVASQALISGVFSIVRQVCVHEDMSTCVVA